MSVGIFRDIPSYLAALNRRKEKIINIGSAREAAKFDRNLARNLAPKKSGETRAGIIAVRLTPTHYQVISDVTPKGKSGFKQNMWANRSSPFVRPRMYWNKWRPTMYGDGSHQITGMPGFFDEAGVQTKFAFADLTIRELHRIFAE